MENSVSIVYIDDHIITSFSKLLFDYEYEDVNITYGELVFDIRQDYEHLLNSEIVKSANVIIIDSKLFEEENASSQKYTGEELKLLFRKIYPYINVIVVTKENVLRSNIFKKPTTCEEFVDFKKTLDRNVKDIIESRELLIRFKETNSGKNNEFLLEQIEDSLKGITDYNNITTADINFIIENFRKIEETLNNE